MRFALYVPNFGTFGQAQIMAELAHEAEAAGWDGFFIWDHLFADSDSQHGPVADPWISLAAIATRTQRIRLGALVTALARRRPWKLARETVTLDHLSNGRLVVGAGIGGDWWREYSAFGEAADDRLHAAALTIQLRTPASCRGRSSSREYRSGWPACGRARGRFSAARWDGTVLIGRQGDLTPPDVEALRAYIQAHRASDGPFDVVLGGRAYEREPAEAAELLARYAVAGVTWWMESFWADVALSTVQSVIRRGPPQVISA